MKTGTVYKSTGNWYVVKTEKGEYYDCRIKGKFRIQGIKSTNPVAVGDVVDFSVEESENETVGVIEHIHDRKNYIVRRSVNLSKQTHILAANVDLVFLLVTLNNPPTSTTFIDRFLVTAEAYDVPTILLLNKMDSYSKEETEEVQYLQMIYEKVGYTCYLISALEGTSVEKLQQVMKGKTCIFSGHSGVGKSTLVNAIAPDLELRTASISEQSQQGQHTTTFAQMYDLSFGARIVDTPGIKGFGVVDMEKDELGDYFPEFFALKEHCKFHNCLHLEEPNCAVKSALEADEIPWSRYDSYVQIMETIDDDNPYRKNNFDA